MTGLSTWPDRLFDHRRRPGCFHLVTPEGSRYEMDAASWHVVSEEDHEVLGRVEGPVLDVGCGPGRHAAELAERGLEVLGLDVSAAAVACARDRGAPVFHGSVFGPVPRSGEWGTILLLDGNVGIGGRPIGLLSRCAGLLRPGGRVLLETEHPDHEACTGPVRIEMGDGHDGPEKQRRHNSQWFTWATVPASQIEALASATGFEVTEIWRAAGRWFAELRLAPRGDEAEQSLSLA